jgi:hypothetical protein
MQATKQPMKITELDHRALLRCRKDSYLLPERRLACRQIKAAAQPKRKEPGGRRSG